MNIHHDLESIKAVAMHEAKEHNCNYNIILHNPNANGHFEASAGSTYEFVADNYFEKPRPNVIRLDTTDNLLKKSVLVGMMDAMEEKKLTPEQETQKIIDHFSKIPEGYDEIREHMAKVDVDMKSEFKVNKIKKGLSAIEVNADGVTYKQGKAGLERMPNTNRNDLCGCSSGKKFKKCCGK